jgi:flagellar hook-associated protein 3 FlgL
MTLTSLGDMAQSFMLRRQNVALKFSQQQLASAMASGRATDTARQVGGDFTALSAIEASLTRLGSFKTATSEAATMTAAMQVALSTVETLASDHAPALLTAANAGNVAAVGRDSIARFEAAVAALSVQTAGRSLFAGVATDGPALADAATILAALDVVTTGATTAAGIEAAVTAWFAAPAGFAATGYLGGAARAPTPIAPGESVAVTATALDPAITGTLKALALGALLGRGALAGNGAAQANLARLSGEALLSTQTQRVDLAAHIGLAEGQIEQAAVRNAAETSALEITRTGIVAVDPYETAMRLEATETQLETLYAITARITRLSLLDFIR